MKALIFNGTLERNANATSELLSNYLFDELKKMSIDAQIFKLADADIPLLDFAIGQTPKSVEEMSHKFQEADVHIWLTPLYHGSMTGAMKNCLDWLETAPKMPTPYLTGKLIGLVCWADGVQAMQGINAMDSVVKSLRAWTLPYSVPIQRSELFDDKGNMNPDYHQRFQLLIQLLIQGPNKLPPPV